MSSTLSFRSGAACGSRNLDGPCFVLCGKETNSLAMTQGPEELAVKATNWS